MTVQAANKITDNQRSYKFTYMELNIDSKAVKAKPMANMLFIFTRDKSLLLFLSRSSSLSIFRFCCRSMLSPCASFFFSTVMKQKYNINEKIIVQAFFQNTFFRHSSREIKLTSLALSLHFCLQLLILFCAIHKQPGQSYGGKECISYANNVSKVF